MRKSAPVKKPKLVGKPASQYKLLDVIRAALDCRSHFGDVKIVQSKEDKRDGFLVGESATVICGLCVDRMWEALGLEKSEHIPQHGEYFNLLWEAKQRASSARKNRKE
jgi:hypothetical protein